MRLPFQRKREYTWDGNDYLWLENVSAEHIMLHLPTGDLRLDTRHKLRFRPDILEQPAVKAMVDSGQLVLRK